MKILSAQQIRGADAYTIQHEPIKSIDLMERAAKACVDWITSPILPFSHSPIHSETEQRHFKIFCGLGNNGGDGLAIARLLAEKKYAVEVFIIRYSEKYSDDFIANEKRLPENISIHNISSISELPSIINHQPSTIIIDSLFGSGLSKLIEGLAGEVISCINNSNATVISIDIPSGLFCDISSFHPSPFGEGQGVRRIVKANHTLSFELPKLAFMFPENAEYVGEWHVLPIGLDKDFISQTQTKNIFLTKQNIQQLFKPRKKFSHKGNYGHALLITGSYGKMGAAVLASKACLRAGAGLLTTHIPKCGNDILQTSVPEAMVDIDESDYCFSEIKNTEKYNAIGIGSGIGTFDETQRALKVVIQQTPVPLVIDADAINILAENKTWLPFIPQGSIYTPHPKEFERLAGKSSNDFERQKMQIDFAVKHQVYVVLKGAHTAIACPDGTCYFNSTGNPGMATAGSGDVLTGIITGLFAQGYSSKEAALLGVFLHGLAGDIAAEKFSQEAMIASDIIECFGEAFKRLQI